MTVPLTTLAVAALAVPGFALQTQEGRAQERPQTRPADAKSGSAGAYVELGKLLGAEAKVRPSGSGAAARPGGDAGDMGDDERIDKVEIQDLIIDTDTGDIAWAVVQANDRTVAVPSNMLKCTPKADDRNEKDISLNVDPAKLKTLPEFDLEGAREEGADASVLVLESSWAAAGYERPEGQDAKPREASAKRTPSVIVAGTQFMTLPGRYTVASELDDLEVFARSEELGSVDKLIVNTDAHEIAFAVVSHGGVMGMGDDKYLIPFDALHAGTPKEDKDKTVLCVDMPAEQVTVEQARYDDPEEGVIDPANAESAKRVFNDASKKKMDGAKKKDEGMEKRTGDSEEGHSDRQGGSQRSGG